MAPLQAERRSEVTKPAQKLFDVFIIEKATRRIAAVMRRCVKQDTATSNQRVVLRNINTLYDCVVVPTSKLKKGDILP